MCRRCDAGACGDSIPVWISTWQPRSVTQAELDRLGACRDRDVGDAVSRAAGRRDVDNALGNVHPRLFRGEQQRGEDVVAVGWAEIVAVPGVWRTEVDVLVSRVAFREVVVHHRPHPRQEKRKDHQQRHGGYSEMLPRSQRGAVIQVALPRGRAGAEGEVRLAAGVSSAASSRQQRRAAVPAAGRFHPC